MTSLTLTYSHMNTKTINPSLLILTLLLTTFSFPLSVEARPRRQPPPRTYQQCTEELAPGTYFPDRGGANVRRNCTSVPIDQNTEYEEREETNCSTDPSTGLPSCRTNTIRRPVRQRPQPTRVRPRRSR